MAAVTIHTNPLIDAFEGTHTYKWGEQDCVTIINRLLRAAGHEPGGRQYLQKRDQVFAMLTARRTHGSVTAAIRHELDRNPGIEEVDLGTWQRKVGDIVLMPGEIVLSPSFFYFKDHGEEVHIGFVGPSFALLFFSPYGLRPAELADKEITAVYRVKT